MTNCCFSISTQRKNWRSWNCRKRIEKNAWNSAKCPEVLITEKSAF